MRTTVDLTPEAYYLAKAVARDKKQSLGLTISKLITERRVPNPPVIVIDELGVPTVDLGRPITMEEVNEIIAED